MTNGSSVAKLSTRMGVAAEGSFADVLAVFMFLTGCWIWSFHGLAPGMMGLPNLRVGRLGFLKTLEAKSRHSKQESTAAVQLTTRV